MRKPILIATLTANALLAVALVRDYSPRRLPATPTTDLKPAATSTAASRAEQQELLSTPAAATPGDTASNANGFEWAQLESDDYKQYIANLRAFGVPEKVIRDIIIADVGKLYRPRFAALRPPKKPANTNFWERQNTWYGQYRDTTPEQRAQMKALQKEQAALIKELLGENVYEEMQKDSGQPDWTERMFGSIPKESREQVSEMFQNFQEQQTDIYAKADGMIDQDTQTELKALRKKFREELATVLTPEQVAEYELRTSDTANQMRYELSSFEPDEAEFRAIFEYKQAKEDFETAWGQEAPDNRPSAEKQKAVEDALAAALGTDRLKEYKMMDDWAYRNLLEAGVEKESVFKIADMKTEVEKAANMIRQDKTLTQEQRNEALKAIRKETEQAMAKLIGERRTKAYANQGGWWLRNISHTR